MEKVKKIYLANSFELFLFLFIYLFIYKQERGWGDLHTFFK